MTVPTTTFTPLVMNHLTNPPKELLVVILRHLLVATCASLARTNRHICAAIRDLCIPFDCLHRDTAFEQARLLTTKLDHLYVAPAPVLCVEVFTISKRHGRLGQSIAALRNRISSNTTTFFSMTQDTTGLCSQMPSERSGTHLRTEQQAWSMDTMLERLPPLNIGGGFHTSGLETPWPRE